MGTELRIDLFPLGSCFNAIGIPSLPAPRTPILHKTREQDGLGQEFLHLITSVFTFPLSFGAGLPFPWLHRALSPLPH